jgi:hypothetical protein
MDGSQIGDAAHLAAEGIDLLDQLALGQAADGGIAGHQGYGVQVDIEQQRFTAHARCGQSRFTARMAAADDDHIVISVQNLALRATVLEMLAVMSVI